MVCISRGIARHPRADRLPGGLPRRMVALTGAVLVLLLAGLMLLDSSAHAASYEVYSCRIPYGESAGSAAPVEVASEPAQAAGRWTETVSGAAKARHTCRSGGALIAELPAGAVRGEADRATWQFEAPEGERIKAATLWRAGDVEGGAGFMFWMAAPHNVPAREVVSSEAIFTGCVYVMSCTRAGTEVEPLAEQNRVVVPSENLGGSQLFVNAGCSKASCPDAGSDSSGAAAIVYLYATAIELEDDSAPTVSSLSGSLSTAAVVSGEASLYFHAADVGSGVSGTVVKLDGKTISEAPIEPSDAHCAPIETRHGLPVYLYTQPCPLGANAHVTINTVDFANGDHQLVVEAIDAAGNRAVALQKTIQIANGTAGSGRSASGTTASPSSPTEAAHANRGSGGAQPVPNGDPASNRVRLLAGWRVKPTRRQPSTLNAPFGRSQTIAGRLRTVGGAPIANAEIEVTAKPAYDGAITAAMKPVRTNARGRFTLRLPPHISSRTIVISYAASVGGKPTAEVRLHLNVHAEVRLYVAPRRTSVGHAIIMTGRLSGDPIPPGGKQVVVEARSRGTGWLQFAVIHTDRRGRFRARHRFRLRGPVRYQFRVVCPREADFPFSRGVSNVVSVFER